MLFTRSLLLSFAVLILSLPSVVRADDGPITPDYGLQDGPTILQRFPNAYRALPSVYIVHTIAKGTIDCPAEVSCEVGDLDQLYDAAVQADEIPAEMPRALFKWCVVAGAPDKYLRASASRTSIELQDTYVGHGTAYAVSREGILLTNRHVVDGGEISPLVGGIVPVGFQDMLQNLVKELGSCEGDAELESIVGESLVDWFARQSDSSHVQTRLAIAAAYQDEVPRKLDPGAIAAQIATKQFGFDTRQPILVPVHVVARGGASWAQDIAILRVTPDARDALICLPLADHAHAAVGTPIFSLGYPAYKYDLASGQRSGLFKVNVEQGEIKALPRSDFAARMLDRNLVTLKAKLRPGCSGGPVILADGRVAAMNVAHRHLMDEDQPLFFPHETDGLAVPLVEIRSLLAAHQITLDPGPTTGLWNKALDDYLRGDRAAAAANLRKVATAQIVHAKPAQGFSQPIVNQYVEELLKLCQSP